MLTPIELIKATVDGMIARKFGRIVNITSGAVKAPIDILGLSNGARSGLTGFVAGVARRGLAAPGVTLNHLLPGGFEPVLNPVDAPNVQPVKKGGFVNRLGNVGGWAVDYADVREERVVLYGAVNAQVAEYRYRIRATNVGTFIVPPAYGEFTR